MLVLNFFGTASYESTEAVELVHPPPVFLSDILLSEAVELVHPPPVFLSDILLSEAVELVHHLSSYLTYCCPILQILHATTIQEFLLSVPVIFIGACKIGKHEEQFNCDIMICSSLQLQGNSQCNGKVLIF